MISCMSYTHKICVSAVVDRRWWYAHIVDNMSGSLEIDRVDHFVITVGLVSIKILSLASMTRICAWR